jgi:hypothetical protein
VPLSRSQVRAAKIGGYYVVPIGAIFLVPLMRIEFSITALILILLVVAPFLIDRLSSFEYGGVKVELRDLEDRVSKRIDDSGIRVRGEIEAVRDSLEEKLADFSRVSADYLRPQPLEISDAKIEELRNDPPTLSKSDLSTALATLNPNLRIPAYIQLQCFPDYGFADEVANCFLIEQFEAATHKETRGLLRRTVIVRGCGLAYGHARISSKVHSRHGQSSFTFVVLARSPS